MTHFQYPQSSGKDWIIKKSKKKEKVWFGLMKALIEEFIALKRAAVVNCRGRK